MRLRLASLLFVLGLLSCASSPEGSPRRPQQPASRPAPLPPPAPRATLPPKVDDPAPPRDPDRSMAVHVLDIGQGSATLVEFSCGAMLVDTGGELNSHFDSVAVLQDHLEAFFARRTDLSRTLALLIITHPHIDHMRGLPMLLDNFRVENIVDNGQRGVDLVKEQQQRLSRYLETPAPGHKRPQYRAVLTDEIPTSSGLTDGIIDPIRCDPVDPQIRVLGGRHDKDPGWRQSAYGKRNFENENNHSVVTRVDFGKSSLLITGDLEDVAIHHLVSRYQGTGLLDVDIYIAGHHGSHNGTTRGLLAEMTPDVAVISAGPASRRRSWTAWRYGHPRDKAVSMLEEGVRLGRSSVDVLVGAGTQRFFEKNMTQAVFATAWDGTVVVEAAAGGALTVRVRDAADPSSELRLPLTDAPRTAAR
jgi:competence protein ComEC